MRPNGFIAACINTLFFVISASAYLVITQPQRDTQWANGQVNLVTWDQGQGDGLNQFDVEMARIGMDGLILVAEHVPAKTRALNILLNNVPAADDYILVFLNSTHGGLYATSPRFAVLPSSATPTSAAQTPNPKVSTVTVTSGPGPTAAFATSFPPTPNSASALSSWTSPGFMRGAFAATIASLVGAVLALS